MISPMNTNKMATPNEVEVDETGCSCFGYCRWCRRSDRDPACPRHGDPLGPDDGDVTVRYPDGTEVVLPPPGLFPKEAQP